MRYKHNFVFNKEYWNGSKSEAFRRTRSGWRKEDFDARRDDTLVHKYATPSGGDLLDVGCGVGYICKIISPLVDTYTGLDWSSVALDVAKSRNKQISNASWVQGDGKTLPFDGGSFDHVVSEWMLTHVSKDGIKVYLHEMVRVLRPGGRLIVQVPNAAYYENGLTETEALSILQGGVDLNEPIGRKGPDPRDKSFEIEMIKDGA